MLQACRSPLSFLAVDIGGNDGTLLRAIVAMSSCAALNIEPSSNIAELANQAGGDVETIVDLWSMDIAHHIASERGSAQIITATNVLNHASDPMEFVAAVEFALDEDGVFVFEVPSLRALVKQRSFDTIYLEHISYFGVKAILHLLGANGLRACHISANPYMGGSLRVIARHDDGKGHAPTVLAQVAHEEDDLLYETATYRQFMCDVDRLCDSVMSTLMRLRADGAHVIGVGAAAKGNTLLGYCGIDRRLLPAIADASPLKIGKFTPGSHIPIISDGNIPRDTTHALILPWNIAGHLTGKLGRPGLSFVIPTIGPSR